jgi:3-hydroxyacyl-CoA dehydrogenase/enoyl-CoA hydratase/3-hydroxybutyryl-CoA epimerase
VGIIGAGEIGTGIASVSLGSYSVRVHDISREALKRCNDAVHKALTKQMESEAITLKTLQERETRFSETNRMDDLGKADLVVEATSMDPDSKRKILTELEERVSPETVIAIHTAFLPVSGIVTDARHKERMVGVHYFLPVHRVPLVELVAPEGVADRALHTAHAFAHAQEKAVIRVKDTPGFYATRVLCRYLLEALTLLGEGHDMQQIDKVMADFGYSEGPFALMDEMGLNTADQSIRFMCDAMKERFREPFKPLGRLVEAGFLGRQSGRGFYVYSKKRKGDKKPNPDMVKYVPRIKEGLEDSRGIRERLLFSKVNEAAILP